MILLQKENKETIEIEIFRILAEKRELEAWTYWDEKLGINVNFRLFLTMVDSGLVNKASDNDDNHKCRMCLRRMADIRQHGNHICSYCHFSPKLNMSMVEFGHSPTHFAQHIGCWLLDVGNRREFREHGKKGYAELKKLTEQQIHDEMLELLGLHVGEPRADGAGTSNTGENFVSLSFKPNVTRQSFIPFAFVGEHSRSTYAISLNIHIAIIL